MTTDSGPARPVFRPVYSLVLPLSSGRKLVVVEGLTSEAEAMEVREWMDAGRGRLEIEYTFRTSSRRIAPGTPATQNGDSADAQEGPESTL